MKHADGIERRLLQNAHIFDEREVVWRTAACGWKNRRLLAPD
jgi:hypothetical protein